MENNDTWTLCGRERLESDDEWYLKNKIKIQRTTTHVLKVRDIGLSDQI